MIEENEENRKVMVPMLEENEDNRKMIDSISVGSDLEVNRRCKTIGRQVV